MHILSCSSTPKRESRPFHSGLGRILPVKTRTMSLFESNDSDGAVSLKGLFDGEHINTPIKEIPSDHLMDLTIRGGWPADLTLDTDKAAKAMSFYARRIRYGDLLAVDNSKGPARMMRVLRSSSCNESTLASGNAIAKDIKEFDDDIMTDDTTREYVSVLDRMCLTEDREAFNPNLGSSVRVGKTPKRHLTDPALATSASGLTKDMLLDDLNTYGLMFGAMCERDLGIYAYVNGGKLLHCRDGKGREIDAVVEMPDGRCGAFGIELGASSIDDGAESLKRIDAMIRDDLNGRPGVPCRHMRHVLCSIHEGGWGIRDTDNIPRTVNVSV